MQRFIELGWHTVPLSGTLERLADGTKTVPGFEKNWREHYTGTKNTKATALGGAITGKCSNIIAIDCDNTAAYSLISSLDPDYKEIFVSVGKGNEICGTYIYEYEPELTDTFSIHNAVLSLDIYTDNGFIYLPTAANKTKQYLGDYAFKRMPDTIKNLLLQLHWQYKQRKDQSTNSQTQNYSCLAPVVSQFLQTRKYMPGLFRIITPKDFREEESYLRDGHLHPVDVPAGRGSEYLMKVSAILGADLSIDEEMYVNAMSQINGLFVDPMDQKRLNSTILDPMITGSSSIDGETIWKFDENWEQHRLIVQTKRQTTLELAFDDNRGLYYAVDPAQEKVVTFSRDTDLSSFLQTVALNAPKKADMVRSIPLVNVMNNPSKDFGFTESGDVVRDLNLFKPTHYLRVLHEPSLWKDKYTYPIATVRYIETLVPDEEMRNYLLRFLRHKLLTFEYSPVILYFMGVHGSGKDTLVQIIEQIIGTVTRPTAKEFLEIYNGWLADSYFVQLDEYGNQLQRMQDKEEAQGRIKAYSGKPLFRLRSMRTDGVDVRHSATFIMTQNKNPLTLEDGDRRIAYFDTPNVLADAHWVQEMGGMVNTYNKIMSEIVDFCYYLVTEVEAIHPDSFNRPPMTERKHELIANSMPLAGKIAYACKHKNKQILLEVAEEAMDEELKRELESGYVTVYQLQEAYNVITEFKGSPKAVQMACKQAQLVMHRTSKEGMSTYKVDIPVIEADIDGEF